MTHKEMMRKIDWLKAQVSAEKVQREAAQSEVTRLQGGG